MDDALLECILSPEGELFRTTVFDRLSSGNRGEGRLFLVRNSNSAALQRHVPGIVKLGEKNRAIPLWKYFRKLQPGEAGIVSGEYRASGQLGRSARRVLEFLRTEGRENLCFVQIPDTVFEEIVDKADKKGYQASRIGAKSDSPAFHVQRTLATEEVPDELAHEYIGDAPSVKLVRQHIYRARKHALPVLIQGESGTGKEIVARNVHFYRHRDRMGGETFQAVNCSAIPDTLIESELFGHAPGAFTDAKRRRDGLWKTAGDGTLFLDEIGELPLMSQAKILRALEENRIRPVGADSDIAVSARIVVATNRDLYAMVRHGTFREDLYYRLRVFLIPTPPLREHPEDIPMIAQWLWSRTIAPKTGHLPDPVTESLAEYNWPGNVRELKTVIAALFAWFGNHVETREQTETIMYLVGCPTAQLFEGPSNIPSSVRKAVALRHIQQAAETLGGLQYVLEHDTAGDEPSVAQRWGLPAVLSERHRELNELCSNPLAFDSPEVYEAVHGATGKLGYMLQVLESDHKPSRRRSLGRELAREIEQVRERLTQHVERLLPGIRS